ncbi:MAG: type III-A CRISPR-associated RAMP protein Csm4 [Chloroherpetonaceae bacterium]|nr:type III-A CRISPR-associated RAMP protein Csm4 [Chloroherpetonaceae bacterium]MCS7211302.1 type III-A CRISPR-associated RAMP protein Csm4 [Chloroherpetonaceae bacterium]
MKALLLLPKPYSQFHFGETGLDETSEILHSDTLFSALANIYEIALSGAEKFINLVNEGKVLFSSGFYVLILGTHKIFFLPKPMCQLAVRDFTQHKKEKKIQYLSFGVYSEVLKSIEVQRVRDMTFLASSLSLLDKGRIAIIGGKFACLKEELAGLECEEEACFCQKVEMQKVKVHTTEQEAKLYMETNVQFLPIIGRNGVTAKGGFYVLLRISEEMGENDEKELLTAFRILADEGIGGERSSGCGQFEYVEETLLEDFPKAKSSSPEYYLGLSLISPNGKEEFASAMQYEILLRGGGTIGKFGDSEQHRKRVRLIAEGAVFKGDVKGRLVDVSPDSGNPKIYRNGKAFTVPIL